MGKVFSFINYKGGVGKTTLAVEVSASIAHNLNAKVLL
jgi:cellulose biosynthesis protein BcsQ